MNDKKDSNDSKSSFNMNLDTRLGGLLITALTMGIGIIIFLNINYITYNEFRAYKEYMSNDYMKLENRLDKIDDKLDKLTDFLMNK